MTNEVFKSKTFIEKANKVHNNKYDYSKFEYINSHTKSEVICPFHNSFYISPNAHTSHKVGCSACSKNRKRTTESFIQEIKEIRGNFYDYSKVQYVNAHTNVTIICPIHGEFKQSPNNHKRGQNCPLCIQQSQTSLAEKELLYFLDSYNPIHRYKTDWLGKMEIDVFLPSFSFGIEYNGIAFHHTGSKYTYMEDTYKHKEYHKYKYDLCKKNNIDLIYIWDFENIDNWKTSIINYLHNPNKYFIQFENTYRESKGFCCYGESFIYENSANL